MLSPDQLHELLKDMIIAQVARKAGVGYQQLYQFSKGETGQPKYEFIAKMNKYFERRGNV